MSDPEARLAAAQEILAAWPAIRDVLVSVYESIDGELSHETDCCDSHRGLEIAYRDVPFALIGHAIDEQMGDRPEPDPTLAADLALADAVRDTEAAVGSWGWLRIFYGPGPNGYRWEVVIGDEHMTPPMPDEGACFGTTLTAAINEALHDDQ